MTRSLEVANRICRSLFFLLPALWLSAGVSLSDAYVLQGGHLLELMIRNMGRAGSLSVEQIVSIPDPESEGGPIEVQEKLTYLYDGRFRSELFSANGHKTFIISGNNAVTVINDEIVDNSQSLLERYIELLLYRSRPALAQRLAQQGIDPALSSLARWEGSPVFVVGASDPRQRVSQIWLEKETFRPLRWISNQAAAGHEEDFLECRFTDWQAKGDVAYPRRMVFYHNDRKVREISVGEIALNPHVSPDEFDIGRVRSTYPRRPQSVENTRDDAGQRADEVKETIDDFKKMYEE